MQGSAGIATVFGGSGFVGRYVCQRLARAGWRIRVAVRRPEEALFVRTYGDVGQLEVMQANIRDDASTRRVIAGVDVVVNCVGILGQSRRQTFDAVIADGAARIARIAAQENVARLVHVSAIGADPESPSGYARAKAGAETAVREAFPTAVILRPSVIFGTEDEFFNRFAAMARLSPVVPVVGPDARFQPVWVDDVAAAAFAGATGMAAPGIYELGGPEVATFRELLERMLRLIGRRRIILTIPFGLASLQGRLLDAVQRLSFGLFTNTILTADQVALLRTDNVVADGARGLADLGIEATPMEAVIGDYLASYRPNGQYEDITASARNLRA